MPVENEFSYNVTPATYALPGIFTTLAAQGIQPGGGSSLMMNTGVDPSAAAKEACAVAGGTWTTSGCVPKAASEASPVIAPAIIGEDPAVCPAGYVWDHRRNACGPTDDTIYAAFAVACQQVDGVAIRPHHDAESAYCQCVSGVRLIDLMAWYNAGQIISVSCTVKEPEVYTPPEVEESDTDVPLPVEESKGINPLIYVAGAAAVLLLLYKR